MTEKRVRHTIKDNIFRDMFSDIRFMYELYQALHPKDNKSNYARLTLITRAKRPIHATALQYTGLRPIEKGKTK